MKNAVNRDIPQQVLDMGYEPFQGSNHRDLSSYKKAAPTVRMRP